MFHLIQHSYSSVGQDSFAPTFDTSITRRADVWRIEPSAWRLVPCYHSGSSYSSAVPTAPRIDHLCCWAVATACVVFEVSADSDICWHALLRICGPGALATSSYSQPTHWLAREATFPGHHRSLPGTNTDFYRLLSLATWNVRNVFVCISTCSLQTFQTISYNWITLYRKSKLLKFCTFLRYSDICEY